MNRSPGILARLFGRSAQPLVATIAAQALGQPLMVHPQMGENLIGAYLRGGVDARGPTFTVAEIEPVEKDAVTGAVVTAPRLAAVLNVSGALVNRYEGDLCDPGPLSYQELRGAFDRAMQDDSVETIVLRIESPGGMAGGLFDLADHIYQARGAKRIVAAIDDYAYSAAYALASAADEVWITRTGGAGSVGVIAYHVDQSGWNAKNGIKVTTVTAGAHKADFNPHAPLGEGPLAWLQQHLDEGRQLFARTVARNRGLELQAVLDTEARTFHGEHAVEIGFADRLGSFHDLMRELREGSAEADPPAAAPAQPSASVVAVDVQSDQGVTAPRLAGDYIESAEDAALAAQESAEESGGFTDEDAMKALAGMLASRAARKLVASLSADQLAALADSAPAAAAEQDPAASAEAPAAAAEADEPPPTIRRMLAVTNALMDAVEAGTLPQALFLPLLKREDLDADTIGPAIEQARRIDDACAAAGLREHAATYVARGVSVEKVRHELISAVADPGPELVTTHPAKAAGSPAAASPLSPEAIYRNRQR